MSASAAAPHANSVLEVGEIQELLPHRYPFLLVDRIIALKPGESATGIKNVTVNEPCFVGHFPGRPIFPGVLVLEALAQTGAVLVCRTLGISRQTSDIYFMGIDKAKFRRPIVPGDAIELEVRILQSRRQVLRFAGHARVAGKCAAECEFSAMFQPRAGP